MNGGGTPLYLDLVDDRVALFILVGGHVPGQVMPFPEALVAHGTPQLLLPPPSRRFAGVLILVVGPHVVHEVGRHPERKVALGAYVLRGQG